VKNNTHPDNGDCPLNSSGTYALMENPPPPFEDPQVLFYNNTSTGLSVIEYLLTLVQLCSVRLPERCQEPGAGPEACITQNNPVVDNDRRVFAV